MERVCIWMPTRLPAASGSRTYISGEVVHDTTDALCWVILRRLNWGGHMENGLKSIVANLGSPPVSSRGIEQRTN
jgi:hypothetical protein